MPFRVVCMPTFGVKQWEKLYSPEYETREEADGYFSIIEKRLIQPFGNQLDCIMCWIEMHVE